MGLGSILPSHTPNTEPLDARFATTSYITIALLFESDCEKNYFPKELLMAVSGVEHVS